MTVVYPGCARLVNVPVDLLVVIGQKQEQHCRGQVLGMSDLKEHMTSHTSAWNGQRGQYEQMMFSKVQAQTDMCTGEAGSLMKIELSHAARCNPTVFSWHIAQPDDMAAVEREKHIAEGLAAQE